MAQLLGSMKMQNALLFPRRLQDLDVVFLNLEVLLENISRLFYSTPRFSVNLLPVKLATFSEVGTNS